MHKAQFRIIRIPMTLKFIIIIIIIIIIYLLQLGFHPLTVVLHYYRQYNKNNTKQQK